MNTFRTISRVLVVAVVVFAGNTVISGPESSAFKVLWEKRYKNDEIGIVQSISESGCTGLSMLVASKLDKDEDAKKSCRGNCWIYDRCRNGSKFRFYLR
ncbi:MAG TPA: hypothetical protein VLB80_04560 [Candidatus Babeliales bacterium]|nr:hypothetical protein [Candidatus Babeliales bacterium]